MDEINQVLARIEEKLDRLINKPVPDVLSVHECMPLTGCKSVRAQYAWFKRFAVRPYMRGRYRRRDVTNARDHAALFGTTVAGEPIYRVPKPTAKG